MELVSFIEQMADTDNDDDISTMLAEITHIHANMVDVASQHATMEWVRVWVKAQFLMLVALYMNKRPQYAMPAIEILLIIYLSAFL